LGDGKPKALKTAKATAIPDQKILTEKPQPKPKTKPKPKKPAKRPADDSMEKQLGVKLPVWIGGIALAFAGYFLVKYSIEAELLSPMVRVSLGGLLGVICLAGAHAIHLKPDFSNGRRISQTLAGAGIVVLYAATYAAINLYDLLPELLGFITMAGISFVAILLSLRLGAPVAVLGLLGGFLTPLMVGSDSSSPATLFTYLYLVFAGIMMIIRKERWWALSLLALVGTFAWVGFWIFFAFSPADTLWPSLFLLAVCGTIALASTKAWTQENTTLQHVTNVLASGGALILLAAILSISNFGLQEWFLYSLLALSTIALAYFNAHIYGWYPVGSMVLTGALLSQWTPVESVHLTIAICLFTAIYVLAGLMQLWRSQKPLPWAALTSITPAVMFLLAYFKAIEVHIQYFWQVLAFAIAAFLIYCLDRTRKMLMPSDIEQGLFACTTTAFITLGCTIDQGYQFLPVVLAAQILAISWINTRIPIKVFRPLITVLLVIFGLLVAPMLLGHFTSNSAYQFEWPQIQIGAPAVLFFAASYFLLQEKDDNLTTALESIAVVLITALVPILIATMDLGAFVTRGIFTSALFAIGATSLVIGRILNRKSIALTGLLLLVYGVGRIMFLDFAMHNPLLYSIEIQGYPIFNTLALPYGLPIIGMLLASRELAYIKLQEWQPYAKGFALILLFVWVSYNIRFFFAGPLLNVVTDSDPETYSYSIAWLLIGVSLLTAGIMQKDKMLRYASLGTMVLTVSKVFLYDASNLEGLLRVMSFLGLGITLIGLSWFYTRYVFKK
ncbi:MAG: DUF2339 domain-containing protein, partial [Alphaproteobacteria bacterium]